MTAKKTCIVKRLIIFVIMALTNYSFAQNNMPPITVLELRNYVLKPGQRERFTQYFAAHFVTSQMDMGGYPLNWFKVNDAPDNFLWLRGFTDMAARSKFLPRFYYGPVWKRYGPEANTMLVNNDNVYLLKPLTFSAGVPQTGGAIDGGLLKISDGIAVVDFYIANTKLDKLITAFGKYYIPAMHNAGIANYTLWISEMEKNDFPRLPVFQDGNLLVAITFYKSEKEYRDKQQQLNAGLSQQVKEELQDIITTKNMLIVYPATK